MSDLPNPRVNGALISERGLYRLVRFATLRQLLGLGVGDVSGISEFAKTILDDEDAAAVIATLDIPAGLSIFTDTEKGVVPASGGGTTDFLRADGTWAVAGGGGGGNGVDVTIVFSDWSNNAETVVTGEAWVDAGSQIVATPKAANVNEADEVMVLQFHTVVCELVAGVGFTLKAFTDIEAKGSYTFSCVGV